MKKASSSCVESDYNQEPSFISDYVDGKPVYSTIRVLSEEEVMRIENDISMEEKREYTRQGSDETLCPT